MIATFPFVITLCVTDLSVLRIQFVPTTRKRSKERKSNQKLSKWVVKIWVENTTAEETGSSRSLIHLQQFLFTDASKTQVANPNSRLRTSFSWFFYKERKTIIPVLPFHTLFLFPRVQILVIKLKSRFSKLKCSYEKRWPPFVLFFRTFNYSFRAFFCQRTIICWTKFRIIGFVQIYVFLYLNLNIREWRLLPIKKIHYLQIRNTSVIAFLCMKIIKLISHCV